jgi:glycosyltransferase involved in cell wall biosynthesis
MGNCSPFKTYCFITREYPSERGSSEGGIGTYVWHMAHLLAVNGFDVTVLSCSTDKEKIYIEDGIKIIRKKIRKPYFIRWFLHVMFFLLKNKFDAIEDTDFSGSTFLYQLFFRRQKDFVHVRLHTCHKIVHYYESRLSFSQKIGTLIFNIIEAYVTRQANLITAPSQCIRQATGLIWRIPQRQIIFLPHPFSISINENQLIPIENDYILYFGRLQERKCADLILELIGQDFLKGRSSTFIVIGKDICNFRNKLVEIENNTIKKTVIIDHISDRIILFSYIKSAKAVFLPSKFESFSLTTLESLWLNPKTFVLNNSGPMEIMVSLGLINNILDEDLLWRDPTELIPIMERANELNTEAIRERITNTYGYKIIYKTFASILNNSPNK